MNPNITQMKKGVRKYFSPSFSVCDCRDNNRDLAKDRQDNEEVMKKLSMELQRTRDQKAKLRREYNQETHRHHETKTKVDEMNDKLYHYEVKELAKQNSWEAVRELFRGQKSTKK